MTTGTGSTIASVASEARNFYWYHCIDLLNGVVTEGDYDMQAYLSSYGFPERMDGMQVLDVGRASGYFAFEFERRGADVTATEIESFLDWDFVGGAEERAKRIASVPDVEAFTRHHITGAFHFAHRTRRSAVHARTATIYDLTLERLGVARPFDLVFAGSVTSHLRDPLRGMAKLRDMTRDGGTCIIAAPYIGLDESLATLAMVADDPDRRSWWVMNKRCVTQMLKSVGFRSANIVSTFDLRLRRDTDAPSVFPHVVAHAVA